MVGIANGHDAHPIVTSFASGCWDFDRFFPGRTNEMLVSVYTKLGETSQEIQNELLSVATYERAFLVRYVDSSCNSLTRGVSKTHPHG